VYQFDKILPFVNASRSERTQFVLIADSNHNYNSVGWSVGLGEAFISKVGQWGQGPVHGYGGSAGQLPYGSLQGAATRWLNSEHRGALTASTDILAFTDLSDLSVGQDVTPAVTGSGLTAGTVYYVSRPAANQVKFHTTLAAALAGTGAIDITADAADFVIVKTHGGRTTEREWSVNTLNGQYMAPGFVPTSTDTGADTVTFAFIHNFTTADQVQVSATGGGLTAGTGYFVRAVSNVAVSFYDTAANASAGGATGKIDLTDSITATIAFVSLKAAHQGYLTLIDGPLWTSFGNLTYKVKYRTYTSSVGTCKPAFRMSATPFTAIDADADTSFGTGADGWATVTHEKKGSATFTLSSGVNAQFGYTHSWCNRDWVTCTGVSGTTDIVEGNSYFVRWKSDTQISLHPTSDDAANNANALTIGTNTTCTITRKVDPDHAFGFEFDLHQHTSTTSPTKGESFIRYRLLEDTTKTSGCAMIDFIGQGGLTARGAYAIQNSTSATAQGFAGADFSENLNGTKSTCVIIQLGGNDRSQGFSKADYKTYMQSLIDWWVTAFSAELDSTLYFALMCSHPQASVAESAMADYRDACKELADENARTCAIQLEKITNATEMTAQSWYDGGGDAHLTAAGYRALGLRVADALYG